MNILLEKNKPLLIYGNPGSGKTHLALDLLKDTVLLRIDSSHLKGISDMNQYINDRVGKRNITFRDGAIMSKNMPPTHKNYFWRHILTGNTYISFYRTSFIPPNICKFRSH